MRICFYATFFAVAASSVEVAAAPLSWAIDLKTEQTMGSPVALYPVQPGYTVWDVSRFENNGFGFDGQFTLVTQGATFELFAPAYGICIGSRQRIIEGGGGGPQNNLLIDFAYADGVVNRPATPFLGLRIAGLPVGTYAMQSWHFDSFVKFIENRIQIEVGDIGQPGSVVVDQFPLQQLPASYEFQVTQPGQVKEIVFRADGYVNSTAGDTTTRTRLNGFSIRAVPEPSTMSLVALIARLWRRIAPVAAVEIAEVSRQPAIHFACFKKIP